MAFVRAYNNDSSEWVDIPESWLSHPHDQFQRFTKDPRQKTSDREKNPAPEPVKKKTESEG